MPPSAAKSRPERSATSRSRRAVSSSAANSRSMSASTAICRRRDRSSENSRAFSSASAAWSANAWSRRASSAENSRPAPVGDAEGADDRAAHAQGHGQDRPFARIAQRFPQVVGQRRRILGENVGDRDGPPLGHRATQHAGAGRRHVAGLEAGAALPPERQRHQRAVGLQEPQHRGAGAEQRQDALDRPAHHVAHVEALGQRLGQSRELLGFVTAAHRLGVESRVLERQRGLVGERLQQPGLRLGEDPAGAVRDRQRADGPALGAHRHRQLGGVSDPGHLLAQLVGEIHVGVVEDLRGGNRRAALHGRGRTSRCRGAGRDPARRCPARGRRRPAPPGRRRRAGGG